MDTNQLIEQLSDGMVPVTAAPRPWVMAARWITGFSAYIALILAFSSIRPDLLTKLHTPLFLAEIVTLAGITIASAFSAAVLSFPDMFQKRRVALMPVVLFAAFIGVMAIAWLADSPPSPAPMHDIECTLCITAYAMLPGLWLFVTMRRFASTHYARAGAVAMLAAFSVGALILRLSEPTDSIMHVVQFHYLPMLAVMGAGMILGKWCFKW